MPEIGYWGAAVAGLLSFLSPCILPMVPFYLCYLTGLSMSEFRETGPKGVTGHRRLVLSVIAFSMGVTTIFMLLGLGATALGRWFAAWHQPLSYIAAGVLTVFGLHLLGVIRVPALNWQASVDIPARPASVLGGYVMGLAFGFGWTPCVGPALTAILLIAAGSQQPWFGASLLLVYGLAMTLPFVIVALFAKPFLGWTIRRRAWLRHVEHVTGAMLIIFALLIATDYLRAIADWMILNFDWTGTLV